MFESSAYRTIKNLAARFPIILLSAPRGCSTTAMVRRLMPTKSYINLEDCTAFSLARQSPKTFLLAFPEGAIIDNVQSLPEIVDAMRYHVGRWGSSPGRFVAVSSCRLDCDTSDGRIIQCNAYGLTMDDLELMKKPVTNPFRTMLSGQLTDVVEGKTDTDTLIDVILEKDVRSRINISNLTTFKRFLGFCAFSSAQGFSVNSLARQSGVSAPTAKVWLSVLQDNLLIRTIAGRADGRSSSFIFYDTGVLCTLLGIRSAEDLILSPYRYQVVRTFAFNELARGRFCRALNMGMYVGDGCDFRSDWTGGINMVVDPNIEVTDERMTQAALTRRTSGRKTVILHLGDVTYTKDGIDCISFRDWTRLAMEIDYFS